MKRNPLFSASLVAGLSFAVTGAAFADPGDGYGGYHMMWGNMFAGPIMMLMMIGVVVIVAVVVMKTFGQSGHVGGPGMQDRSLAILNERFARGEIDKEEYESRKKALAG